MFSTTRNWLGFVLGMAIFFVIAVFVMALSLVAQFAESCGRGRVPASEAETQPRQPAVRAPIVVTPPKRTPAERGYIQPRRLSVGASLPTRPGHVTPKQQTLRYFPGFLAWVVDTSDAEIGQWN